MAGSTLQRLAYAALVTLRVWSALVGYAYIHPDEYFQSGEAAFADIFGLQTTRTWEFDASFPCRSMASIRVANLPAALYAAIRPANTPPNALTVFRLQRLTFLAASFCLDLAVYCLSPRGGKFSALLFLAASSSLMTFQLRPFSNSVEAIYLALSLLAYRSFSASARSHSGRSRFRSHLSSGALGLFASLGFFSRFTFILFFLPIGIAFVYTSAVARPVPLLSRLTPLLLAALAFAVTSAWHVVFDSTHFSGRRTWVVTPLNAFLYNVRPQNVALHGLHPRWLHLVINLPMVVGVATVAVLGEASVSLILRSGRTAPRAHAVPSDGLLWALLLTPLIGLSISPHQEPRFLLPLLVPTTILCMRRLASPSWSGKTRKRTLLAISAIQQAAQLFLFGFAHQGGLIPALIHIDQYTFAPFTDAKQQRLNQNGEPGSASLYFWKTFMVPRHLLPALSKTGGSHALQVREVNSWSASRLVDDIVKHPDEQHSYVVTPAWALVQLERALESGNQHVRLVKMYSPHLDLDHIPEMVQAVKAKGLRDGLGLAFVSMEATGAQQ